MDHSTTLGFVPRSEPKNPEIGREPGSDNCQLVRPLLEEDGFAGQLEADEGDRIAKDAALLASGFTLASPAAFSARINRMVSVALDVADQSEELPPIVEPAADEGTSADAADPDEFDDID